MRTKLTFIVILLFVSMSISAQEASYDIACLDREIPDTTVAKIVVPIDLINDYYKNANFLNHTYDYETTNNIKYLKMQARNVLVLGFTIDLGLMAIGSALSLKYDWPLWAYIPVATVIAMGTAYSFILWSNSIKQKANAIEEHSIYLQKINDNIDLGVTRYINKNDRSDNALGLALKITL